MRKRWIFIALAVGLLAAAVTGGVALAWGGGGLGLGWGRGHDNDRLSALADRVAGILGTDADETADAIAQAQQELRDEANDAAIADVAGRVATTLGTDADATAAAIGKVSREMYDEALESKLQDAIDDGRMTEEQAQEYRDGVASMGHHGFGYGFKGDNADEFANRVGQELDADGGDVKDAIEQALGDIRTGAIEDQLQAAVDSGRITQEQADEIRERVESGDTRGFGKRGHHGRDGLRSGWGRGHGRWHGSGSDATPTPVPASDADSA